MTAIVTGSRAYGILKPTSDLDLVVLVTEEDRELLASVFGETPELEAFKEAWADAYTATTLRVGKLNLVMVTDPAAFSAWRLGTAQLKAQAPVTREQAVKVIANLLAMVPE